MARLTYGSSQQAAPGAQGWQQKYGITTGKVYEATISIIKKGPCTPIIVELKGLDRIDYFESQSSKQ